MRKSPWVLASILALSIQACTTVGPDYVRPETGNVTILGEELVQVVEREARWWQHFGDPELDTVVSMALENNLSLKMAAANVERSMAVFEDVDNDNLPTGNLSATYGAQDQVVPGVSEERINSRSYEFGAGLSWRADLFGKIERSRQFALANAQAESLALRDLQVSIVARCVQAYGELKGLKSRILLVRKNARVVEQTKAIVQSRYEEGYASELDLKRVETQYYRVVSDLPVFEADYRRTRNFLEALLGSQQALGFLHFDQLNEQSLALNQPFAIGQPGEFLKFRPDVHQAERRLAAASANIGVNVADLYPDLRVGGFVGYLSGDLSTLGAGTEAWRVAPTLSWQLFDYASIQARIRAANAEERNAYFAFRDVLLSAIKEADTGLDAYARNQERQHLLQAQFEASQAAYLLARELYDSGEIGLLDLLDAERQALAVEDALVVSNIQTFTAIVSVYDAFGGGVGTPTDSVPL